MRKLNEVLKQDKYSKYCNNIDTTLRSRNKKNNEETKNSFIVKKQKLKNVYEDFDTTLFNNFM